MPRIVYFPQGAKENENTQQLLSPSMIHQTRINCGVKYFFFLALSTTRNTYQRYPYSALNTSLSFLNLIFQ